MLQDKRNDLDSEKQKKLLERLIAELSKSNPDLYYQPTVQIARLVKEHIDEGADLSVEDRALFEGLSQRDIQVLLSLH
ncbi:MAG: hypothetical protein AAGE80_14740 [Pseudomonadota bacterium]